MNANKLPIRTQLARMQNGGSIDNRNLDWGQSCPKLLLQTAASRSLLHGTPRT